MATRRYPPPAEGYPLKLFGGRVPKAALFGQDLTLWGDGTYSGNVVQGGVILQPQVYNLAGVGLLANCIVVTGEATVAPNAETGASVVMGQNLVVIGASASLKPSTNSKGLILLFNKGVYARDGGKMSTDRLGKAGNYGNLTAYDLAPAVLRAKIKKTAHDAYVVLGEGAPGGVLSGTRAGVAGAAAAAMQTGGGGTGGYCTAGTAYTLGQGGKGGPCCGGAGSGGVWTGGGDYTTGNAGPYGGPGTAGAGDGYGLPGGAGDPIGPCSGTGCTNAEGAGGGLLMLFSPSVSIASGCVISADGAKGGYAFYSGYVYSAAGSAGGGCVCIVASSGGYANSGTVRASGGASVASPPYNAPGGSGGAGSVNIFTV